MWRLRTTAQILSLLALALHVVKARMVGFVHLQWPRRMPLPLRANGHEIEGVAKGSAALLDISHFGLINISGDDRLRFLHNQVRSSTSVIRRLRHRSPSLISRSDLQLTNSFLEAKPGSVLHATYATALGRTVDLVIACVLDAEVLLLCSPTRRKTLLESFDKYIFPLDRVRVHDKTESRAVLSVVGPKAHAMVSDALVTAPPATGAWKEADKVAPGCLVVGDSGLGLPGYVVLGREGETMHDLQSALLATSARPEDTLVGGEKEWHALRIIQGRPYPDKELTADVTPLEAGLWHTVHFDKGCYLGQETIAKVANNNGERQKLYGLRVTGEHGARLVDGARLVTREERKRAGVVTSVLEGGIRGLGYIRKGVGEPGGQGLLMEGPDASVEVEVVEIPYASRCEAQAAAASRPKESAKGEEGVSAADARAAADAKAAEAERKAKKLEDMRRRLDEFQKAQQRT